MNEISSWLLLVFKVGWTYTTLQIWNYKQII